jgi:hypothetical protein
MEVDNSNEGSPTFVEEGELLNYNNEDVVIANEKAAKKLAIREMLAKNGLALIKVLRQEPIKAHYVLPMSKEQEMSIEDMLLEIPTEDLTK